MDGVGHILVDDHGHAFLAVADLAAVDPDGFGVIDLRILVSSCLRGFEEGRRLTNTLKEGRMPAMKSVALAATGTKPDLMPGVVMFGVETPMGTHGAAKDDCVTVWF